MSQVLFYAINAAQYAAISTKNPNALYFITDGNRIYKGAVPYTHPVAEVTSFPASGEVGTLYIHKTTYEAKIWDGSAWSTVSLPVVTSIGASPTNSQLPTAQAVKNYVDSEIVNVNSGISGAVSNVGYEAASKSLSVQKGAGEAVVTALSGLFDGVSYNGATGVLSFTANGGAPVSVNLPVEQFLAAAAKDSIVNVSGALGVLANMGIKGSLAGTALRKSYSQFAKTDIQNKLKAIGIATIGANGNLRSMPDIMADIAKAMATMPTAKRLGFAEEIFDLRGSLAGLQLGGNIDQLNAFIAKLKSVNGVAAQTALEMDKGIGGAFRRFMSAVEGVQIAIGRIIGDAIAPYMDKISQILNRMAEWCAAHKEVIIMAVKVIAGVAALGAALIVAGVAVKAMALAVGGLCTMFTILKVVVLAPIAAVKGLIAAFTLLKTVLIGVKVVALATWAAISSPAVLVAVALGVLVAAVWKLTGAWDMCADGVRGLAADFGTAFKAIGEVVGQTWEVIKIALSSGDLAGAAKVGLAALKVVWLTGLFPLKKAWFELKNFLDDSWTITVYSILKLANNLWYGLLMGLKQIGDAMQDAWSFIWDGIVTTFEKTVLELQKAWIRTKGLFDSDEEVNAQIAVVEKEYSDRKSAREQKSADAVNRRESERKALGDEWDSSNKSIDDAMNQEIMENQQAYRDALGGAAAEIEAAKGQWQSAMDEVKKRAA